MNQYKKEISCDFSLQAAIVAEYLFTSDVIDIDGEFWVKRSIRTMRKDMPYLSAYSIEKAVKQLLGGGIIRKKFLQKHLFNHTSFYAFTEYGKEYMTNAR